MPVSVSNMWYCDGPTLDLISAEDTSSHALNHKGWLPQFARVHKFLLVQPHEVKELMTTQKLRAKSQKQ